MDSITEIDISDLSKEDQDFLVRLVEFLKRLDKKDSELVWETVRRFSALAQGRSTEPLRSLVEENSKP